MKYEKNFFLNFLSLNFQSERHIIMQVVCEATQCLSSQVKVAALQCLVRIMSLYYQHMEHYMQPALFPVRIFFFDRINFFKISMQAMKSNEDEVMLKGIEFWSNVCEEEISLSVEADEVV